MIKHDDDYGMVYCWFYHIIEFLGIILPCGYSFGRFEQSFCPDVSTYVPYVSGGVFNILYPRHGSLNVPIEHHPTIRYMVYNGYYKVMSNIPKMGQLPTPERLLPPRGAWFLWGQEPWKHHTFIPNSWISWFFGGQEVPKAEALVPVWRTAFASAESVLQTGTNVSEFGSRGHPDLASKCLLLCLRLAVEGILISRRLMSDTGTLSFHACKRARTSSLRWSSWTLVSLALW